MSQIPENSILVLEGGSLRCLFTAGVLDVLMEQGVDFPAVAGVSAGSLSGINYLSGQIGRTARINFDYIHDKRYLSFRNLLRTRSVFNFDFLFNEVSNELLPLDYDAFHNSPKAFFAFSTDCRTGEPVVHQKGVCPDILLATRASSSMPLLAPMVEVEGKRCLDGGISIPVPARWAVEQGYEKIVVVQTRHSGYRKRPVGSGLLRAYRHLYRDFPLLVERLRQFPVLYNEVAADIRTLEQEGRVFVLRPSEPVAVSRLEKDPEKLKALYRQGREEATTRLQALRAYLEN